MLNETFKVHQIWYQGLEHLPERYHVMRATWHKDECCYRLWDKQQIDVLFHQYPVWNDTYKSLTTIVERVDFAKYLILYHEGGLYADMDIYKCTDVTNLQKLFRENEFVAFAHNASRWTMIHHKIFGMKGDQLINNAVIISKQKSPILVDILNESSRRIEKYQWLRTWSRHLRIVLTTGPLMYSNVVYQSPYVKVFKGKDSFEPYTPAQIRTLYSRGLTPEQIAKITMQKSDIFGVHFMDLTWLSNGPNDPRQRLWVCLSKLRRLPET